MSAERLTEEMLRIVRHIAGMSDSYDYVQIPRQMVLDARTALGASVSPSDSEERERRIKAVIRVLTPHLSLRCPECAGTGIRLVSNLDCYSCDDGIRRDLTAQARATAIEVLTAVSAIEGRG